MTIVSPCVGVCRLDEATGYCLGCARTGDEIAVWRSVPEADRASIWEALPDRFMQLGVACRRLPWDTEAIRAFVAEKLRTAKGTWVAGVVGAVAEFSATAGARTDVKVIGDTVLARTPGGGLRFIIDDHVRALTFETKDTPIDRSRIVLAVKRERGRRDCSPALTALGPDKGAIDPADRATPLFDLGLGRKEARFCVRIEPGPAQDVMLQTVGVPFPENLARIGPSLLAESPVRVVKTTLGRIEIDTPIPPPDGSSPAGPHTHILPDHLATGRAMPAGLELPRAYLPGAIFYPAT